MGVTVRRMRAPRLVRGGVRCNGVFYPLRSEEEAILGLLQSKPSATTDELLGQMARTELSDSQNNKRKVDAVLSINKLFRKIANNTLIKVSKDTTDKRQHIYYLKRNVLS
jgi:outer membrane PBP1 activator LpoA protein